MNKELKQQFSTEEHSRKTIKEQFISILELLTHKQAFLRYGLALCMFLTGVGPVTAQESDTGEEPNPPLVAPPEQETTLVTVLSSGANLRVDPTTNSDPIGRALAGEQLTIIDTITTGQAVNGNSTWYEVMTPDGLIAFVHSSTVSTPQQEAPTPEPVPVPLPDGTSNSDDLPTPDPNETPDPNNPETPPGESEAPTIEPTPEQLSTQIAVMATYTSEQQNYFASYEWDYKVGAPTRKVEVVTPNGETKIIIEHWFLGMGETPADDIESGWATLSSTVELQGENGEITTLRIFNPENKYVNFQFTQAILDTPEAFELFQTEFLNRYPEYAGKNINIVFTPGDYTQINYDRSGSRGVMPIILDEFFFRNTRNGENQITLLISISLEANVGTPSMTAPNAIIAALDDARLRELGRSMRWMGNMVNDLYYIHHQEKFLLEPIE